MHVTAAFAKCAIHHTLYTTSCCRYDWCCSAWPALLQDKARNFMQGILASLPGFPAVCSLNCISSPAPHTTPVHSSPLAGPSSAKGIQTPGTRPGNDQLKTPAPHGGESVCSPMSCSSEQPTPVLGAPNSLAAAPWLVISRLERGQPPLIMQIPVNDGDSISSDQHAPLQASAPQVIMCLMMHSLRLLTVSHDAMMDTSTMYYCLVSQPRAQNADAVVLHPEEGGLLIKFVF